jgi:hypothetical protein
MVALFESTDDVRSESGRKCAQQQYLYEFDIPRSVVVTGFNWLSSGFSASYRVSRLSLTVNLTNLN